MKFEIEDASGFRGMADALYTPESEEELVQILRQASSDATPVTLAGARTGVAGGCVPDSGIVISLERFRTLDVSSGQATAGAGVLLSDLQSVATRTGQFYAPDPTENSASIGGTIATNASGSRSFRFGDTRRHVLALRIVLIDGTVIDVSRGEPVPFDVPDVRLPPTTKFSAGFPLRPGMDYLDLFIGSEGVLGVVTQATLRLLPASGELLSGVVFFPSDEAALLAVDSWRPVHGVRMLEYMDKGSLGLLRPRFSSIPDQADAALLIEADFEADAEIDAWDKRLTEARALSEASWFGTTASDRERFRVFRHALPEAVNETVRRRGLTKMGTDFAVPIAQNHAMMNLYVERLQQEFPDQYVIFGHIGDAHVHVNVLPRNQNESARARALFTEFATTAVSLGGTVAAEHGLGKRKAHLLAVQWPPHVIDAMKQVKSRFDPQWLLGRGNLFPL